MAASADSATTQPAGGGLDEAAEPAAEAELGPRGGERPASPGGRTSASGSERASSECEVEESSSFSREESSQALVSGGSEHAAADVDSRPRQSGTSSTSVASARHRPIAGEEGGDPGTAEPVDSEDSASQRSSQSGQGEMAAWSRLQELEREMKLEERFNSSIMRDVRHQFGRDDISAVREMLLQKKRPLLKATSKKRPDVPAEAAEAVRETTGAGAGAGETEELHSTVIDLSFRPNLETSHGGSSGRMSETYLKMMDLDKYHKHEMGDMRMMLADGLMDMSDPVDMGGMSRISASQSANRPAVRRAAKGMLLRRTANVPTVKLDAIDESENDLESVESVASHFNVSSDDSGDNVGDLTDFIDGNDVLDLVIKENWEAKKEIDRLREEAAQRKKVAQDLAVETAAKEAHYESKIHRLTQQLEMEQKCHAVTREQLAVKRGAVPSGTDEKQQLELTKLLEAAQVRNATLQEGKRIAEARVEDLKRAVALEQQRHKKEAEELMQKMGSGSAKTGGGGAIGEQPFELRSRLKSAQEEKNVLINTFEGKEVQWKTQIEDTQLEMEGMKRKHEAEIKRLESVIASRAREQYDPSSSPLEETNAISASGAASGPEPAGPDTKWWVCPIRNPVGGAPKPAYCQEFCWKVLCTVSGNLALWCSMRDYTILEASREASVVWGSSLLTGKSIFSLASGASSAAWLKKAFHCHQRMAEMEMGPDRGAPTFIVRDLGCEAFVSKSGEPFDCSVITACFPAESAGNRPAVLLVILQPVKNATASTSSSSGGKPQPKPNSNYSQSKTSSSGRHTAQLHMRHRSSQSELSQSSVSPSDSASNILGF